MAVFSMTNTRGWELVRQHLERNIERCRNSLETTTFDSLDEATAIQGEIRGLKKAIEYADKRVKIIKNQ